MDSGGALLTLRRSPAAGLMAQVVLLAALGLTVGLSALGWVVGLVCGAVLHVTVARGLARRGGEAPGPADIVTLTRATLACGVAALVADSFLRQPAVTTLVTLAVVALVLDGVDGWVARRTGTASAFGARFDGEVDAFLILVLSVYVAPAVGWWVLAIGAARYVFALAGWGLAWLRQRLPLRWWRKVVAATQGIVLTVVAADVVPRWLEYAALAVALALLTESFGRDVWWLWRRRSPGAGRRSRAAVTVVANVLALLLVWFALLAPNQASRMSVDAFLRIPAEGLIVAGLALVLPLWGRRAMAAVAGVLLGLLTVVKVADMGFFAALDRPFNLVTDRGYFSPIRVLVRDAVGPLAGDIVVAAALVLAVAVVVCMPLSLGRLTGLVARHRGWSLRAIVALAVVWVAFAAAGLQSQGGEPIASANAGRLAVDHVRAIGDAVRGEQRFDDAVKADRYDETAGDDLLTGLRGKDVLVAFVESYGRVAVEGAPSSPQVRAVLDSGASRLGAAGYSSRSAFLTSPTFGGVSWLAHATLQTGLWVTDQLRYDRLLSGDRASLSSFFGRAGWRTVALMPATRADWPEGERFYEFDMLYDRRTIDYLGPRFAFGTIPDQYALAAFQRLELAERDRPPVMAMVELASSHAPWAPRPEMVDWDRLGDGSVFEPVHERAESAKDLWRHRDDVAAAYADAVGYSLSALISFVEEYGDEDLVLIVVGDHQPATVVSGHEASRDVPVTVIAHDQEVIDRIYGWGWQDGMTPDAEAPVWRMDDFRDRFVVAFSRELRSMPSQPGAP